MKTGLRLPIDLALASFALASIAMAAGDAAAAPATPAAEYMAVRDRIAAEAKADKEACGSYSGNAKDVCLEQAKGKEKVARAELEYNQSGKSSDAQKLAIAKAESAYSMAKEMCDDKGGNSKEICVAEAKAARIRAVADVKMNAKVADARKEAVNDKRDADYQVALKKCDALAGDTKSACVATAKLQFNKN